MITLLVPGVGIDADGIAKVIVALTGLIAALYGVRRTERGRKVESRQQQAVNEIQAKAQDHDYYRNLVSDQREELDRKDAQIDRRDAEIEQLHLDRTKDRLEYRGELSHLRDIIATLRDVVHSEIAKTIADDGIDGSPPALAIEHHTPSEDPHV